MQVSRCNIFIVSFTFLVLCSTISANSVTRYVASKDLNGSVTQWVTPPCLPLEQYGQTYYYISGIYKGNYHQAIQFCNYHGMSLVSIETEEENTFLFQSLKKLFTVGEYLFWTSGTKLAQDSYLVWLSTGKPMIYASWLPNQPDDAQNKEKCVELRFSHSTKTLMWNDHQCELPKYAICEITLPQNNSHLVNNISGCDILNVPSQ